MSGEVRVHLPASFEPLIVAAAKVADAGLPRFVVIGGVAVAVRLSEAAQRGLPAFDARATLDVDAAARGPGGASPFEHLATVGLVTGPPGDHEVEVDGVTVQVIPVEPVGPADLDGLSPEQVLFLGGHWYAAETSEPMSLAAGSSAVEVPVAAPAALVATKLHAAIDRRDPRKVGGDVLDLHHLLAAFDTQGDLAARLSERPRLAEVVTAFIERVLVADAERSIRAVRSWTDTSSLSADDLRDVGDAFVSRLRTLLNP